MKTATTALLVAGTLIGMTGLSLSEAAAQQKKDVFGMDLTGWDITVGAGLMWEPEFKGSDENEYNFWPVVDVTYGGFFANTDQGVGYNFIQNRNLKIGASVNYVEGRDTSDDASHVLHGLESIDNAIEIGLHTEFAFDYVKFDAAALFDVNGTEGQHVTAGVSVGSALSSRFRVVGRLGAEWGTLDYNQAWFGVSQEAVTNNSNLNNTFDAEAGFTNITLGITADYKVTNNIGILGRVGAIRYVGEAEKSPIIKDLGSDQSYYGGLALTYTF